MREFIKKLINFNFSERENEEELIQELLKIILNELRVAGVKLKHYDKQEIGILIKNIVLNFKKHIAIKKEQKASKDTIYAEVFFDSLEETNNKLLDLTKLACMIEQKGLPEEHSYKLAIMFGNFGDAIKYLYKFSEKQGDLKIKVIHDACLFVLPEMYSTRDKLKNGLQGISEIRVLRKWQEFAKQDNYINIFDPDFKQIIANAEDIFKLINQDFLNHYLLKKSRIKKDELNKKKKQAKKDLAELRKNYKTIKNKIAQGHKPSDEELEQYDFYSLKQQKIFIKYAEECAGTAFISADGFMIKAYFAKHMDQNKQYNYFLNCGLSKAKYYLLKTLNCLDDDVRVPPIAIDGADLGYPGYYLRRLNVSKEEDAVLAACLGKLTDCCQSLSGEAGESCTIHGLTSREGGFYVICKGDINSVKPLEDILLYQTWVWRSNSNALVMDLVQESRSSYEIKDIHCSSMANHFYHELAYQLVRFHQIPRVCIGGQNGEIILNLYTKISAEIPKDYFGYMDAGGKECIPQYDLDQRIWVNQNYVHQRIWIEQNELYCVFGKEKEFVRSFETAENSSLIEMLNFALQTKHAPLKQAYCKFFSQKGQEIIEQAERYLEHYHARNTPEVIQSLIESQYLIQLFPLDNKGLNLLQNYIISNIELLPEVLKNNFSNVIKQQDKKGNTALHLIYDKIYKSEKSDQDILEKILIKIPPEELMGVIKKQNNKGESFFFKIIGNEQKPHVDRLLKIMLENRSSAELCELLKQNNNYGQTTFTNILTFHLRNACLEIKSILKKLAFKEIFDLLETKVQSKKPAGLGIYSIKSIYGIKNLDLIVQGNNWLLEMIFDFPVEQLLIFFNKKTTEGDLVLHKVIENTGTLVLDLILKNKIFQSRNLITLKNNRGNTMLHMAFNHSPEYSFFTGDILVKSILNVIDQEDLVNIIKEKNNDGDNILHLAAKKGLIVFNTVMAPIPEENVFDGIKEQNNDGNTVLHLVIKNWFKNDLGKIASTWLYAPIFNSGYLPNKHQNKVLDKLLTSLSPEQLLYLFNQKNNSQEDILDIAETVSATLHQKLLDILESILDVAETVSATLYKNLFDRFCNSVVTPNYLKLTAKPNF